MTSSAPQVQVLLGKRQAGKTTLMRRLMANLSRTVVLDPARQLPAALATSDVGQARRYVERWADEDFTAAYRPNRGGADEDVPLRGDFAELAKAAIAAAAYGRVTVILDEAQLVADSHHKSVPLNDLANFGAHYGPEGVDLLVATRRSAELPRAVSSQADRVFVFRQHESIDVAYVKSTWGHLPGFMNAFRSLGRHDYLSIDTRTDEVRVHYTGALT